MSGVILKASGVSAGYGGMAAVEGVSLEVRAGSFIGVTGPNGGGKTTLLKVILGLLPPLEGRVEYFRGGKPCGGLRAGYMPQQAQIDRQFPMTVREMVMSGMIAERRPLRGFTEEQRRRAAAVEEKLGLGGIARRPVGQLSGGQLQRALLGRAVVSEPELLVLDEPDASLDSASARWFCPMLEEMNGRCAVIMVSHDIGAIARCAKSAFRVNRRLAPYVPPGGFRRGGSAGVRHGK